MPSPTTPSQSSRGPPGPLSSTGGSRGLNVQLRSSSSVLRPRHPKGWRPGEPPLPLLLLLPALEGSPELKLWSVIASSSSVLRSRPKGRPGELPLPRSTGRELCSLPDPPSNRSDAVGVLSPLGVLGAFTFGRSARRQFSRLAPKGGGRESFLLRTGLSWHLSVPLVPMVTLLACLPVALPVSVPASWDRPCRLLLWQLRS